MLVDRGLLVRRSGFFVGVALGLLGALEICIESPPALCFCGFVLSARLLEALDSCIGSPPVFID